MEEKQKMYHQFSTFLQLIPVFVMFLLAYSWITPWMYDIFLGIFALFHLYIAGIYHKKEDLPYTRVSLFLLLCRWTKLFFMLEAIRYTIRR